MAPIRLAVSMMGSREVVLHADPEDTVAHLQDKVLQSSGLKIEDLKFVYQSKPLSNQDTTLAANGIVSDAQVYAAYKLQEPSQLQQKGQPLMLKVTTLQGNTIAVQAGADNTVGDFREVVANRLGLSTVKLAFKGSALTDDAATLDAVGIGTDSTLFAMHRL